MTFRILSLFLFAAAVFALMASPAPASHQKSRWADSEIGWQSVMVVEFAVTDLDRAVAFYRDSLDLDVAWRSDEIGWAQMTCPVNGLTIGLSVQERVKPGDGSLNFGVNDVAHARRVLEKRGVTFLGPNITIPGVIQLADFRDPDGNRIRLAGPPDQP